jgi:hypothetical protein
VRDHTGPRTKRRIARGEGEVTEWPRGLVDYVPAGGEEGTPSPDEDRTGNRLSLAARLLGILRARGEDVERELALLRAAKRAYAANDRARATEIVERLLGELDSRVRPAGSP